MRFIILLLILSLGSCVNLSKDWQKNYPSYKYAPPYLNQPYNPYTPRKASPYVNNNPYMNQYPPRSYGYNPHDYDSQYREPYRAYRRYDTQQQNNRPHIDNDQTYYYNYPPSPNNNPGYYQNNMGQQGGYQNQQDVNDYEVAR